MPVDRLRRHALRVVGLAAVGAGLWLALRGLTLGQLARALERTNAPFVVAWSLVLLALGSVLRTARFRALFSVRDGRPRFFALWSSVVLSAAGNNVLPLRAGEFVRTRETVAAGAPLGRVVVAQVSEKVVEAASLVVFAIPVVASTLGLGRPRLVIAAMLVGCALLAWVAARRGRIEPAALGRSFAWSLLADAVEVALVSVCLRGLALPAGLLPSVTVFIAVNLAIALPSTPGNVGALEAGAALPLLAMGVERDAAVAFALVYRGVQWLPVTLAGAALWTWRSAWRRPTPGTTPARVS